MSLNDDNPDFGALDPTSVAVISAPANGTVSADPFTGIVTYTPNPGFIGTDSFRYTIRDDKGALSNEATATIRVVQAPVAVDDIASSHGVTPVAVDVLVNDSDPDGTLDPTSVTVASAPANGSTSVNSTTGAIIYTPNAGFLGTDAFTYIVWDADGLISNAATVTVTVVPNQPPLTANDASSTIGTASVGVNVLANDSDQDGTLVPATVAVTSGPAHGRVDVDPVAGRITYTADPGFSGADTFTYTVGDDQGAVSDPATVTVQVTQPLPAFALHSRPGATKVIFLDFDGHTTIGTEWNYQYTGGAPIGTAAYTLDNDPAFSPAELDSIARVWQRVAEDFAPFDVDVTTEDPGVEALRNTGGGDTHWGIRVAIGAQAPRWYGAWFDGGVAYISSFNWDTDTPAFVFNTSNESALADSISHEVGHTLGLSHHGRTVPPEEYYSGHSSGAIRWAPLMGSGPSDVVLSQWSRGEYPNASRPNQDDLAIITTQNGFTYRPDDHGDVDAAATPMTASGTALSGAGVIERNTDVDVFRFTVTTPSYLHLHVAPAALGPNLDILANLYSASGLLATSNPPDALDASFDVLLNPGTYWLHVDGTGKGDLATGYSDYGSLGQYTVLGEVSLLANIGDRSVNEGETLTFTATASVAAPQYSLAGAPAGAVIDPASGAFSWTPMEEQGPGTFTFSVLVTAGSLTGSTALTVTVNEVNAAPVLAAIGPKRLSWGQTLRFTATATDSDNAANDLTFSMVGALGATIDPKTGEVVWMTPPPPPAPYLPGTSTYTFWIFVTDNGNPALMDEEQFTVTVAPAESGGSAPPADSGPTPRIFAVGAGTGNDAAVKVYNSNGTERLSFIAYDQTKIGVRTAVGDLNGDGFDDVVVGTLAGPGIANGHVRAFDGRTGALLASFLALPGYVGGVFVAVGDINGDGSADVIVSVDQASTNGDPNFNGGLVRVFDGRALVQAGQQVLLSQFQAYPGFNGGVRVAAGDIDGDGKADVVTGTGPGVNQPPHVKVFSAGSSARLLRSYLAYGAEFFGGVYVAVGNLDDDGFADVVTSADTFGHVKGFRSQGNTEMFSFLSFDRSRGGTGGPVGTADLNGDGVSELLESVREPGTSTLRIIDPFTTLTSIIIGPFPGFAGDLSVSS